MTSGEYIKAKKSEGGFGGEERIGPMVIVSLVISRGASAQREHVLHVVHAGGAAGGEPFGGA